MGSLNLAGPQAYGSKTYLIVQQQPCQRMICLGSNFRLLYREPFNIAILQIQQRVMRPPVYMLSPNSGMEVFLLPLTYSFLRVLSNKMNYVIQFHKAPRLSFLPMLYRSPFPARFL